MTTVAAKIVAQITADSTQFQKGVTAAERSANSLTQRIKILNATLKANPAIMGRVGEGFAEAGKRMTQFVTIPILGFFALLIKKALDADTAMSKLGKESLERLNTSLAKLGEKFLPLFIKMIDGLTRLIDKFLAADPATQKFITMLFVLAAMAGPAMQFAGVLFGMVSTLATWGVTLTTVGNALAAFGTLITGTLLPALLPLLPVLALIAAAVFAVWLAWSNWDQISTTVKQLWFLIKYAFKEGVAFVSDLLLAASEKFGGTFTKIYDKIKKVWEGIKKGFGDAFRYVINIATRVFAPIATWISKVIAIIAKLKAAFASIKLPAALTPGSPTPFEMGLRGIATAMNTLSRKSLPEMNASLAPAGIAQAGSGGRTTYIDNRRFNGNMGAEELKTALNSRMSAIAGGL